MLRRIIFALFMFALLLAASVGCSTQKLSIRESLGQGFGIESGQAILAAFSCSDVGENYITISPLDCGKDLTVSINQYVPVKESVFYLSDGERPAGWYNVITGYIKSCQCEAKAKPAKVQAFMTDAAPTIIFHLPEEKIISTGNACEDFSRALEEGDLTIRASAAVIKSLGLTPVH
jgi:hypothetical protein